MTRSIHKLSARAVATLTKPGRHSDGGGLYLSISSNDGTTRRRWVFLYKWRGKVREMGLGSVDIVPLGRARQLAADARVDVAAGRDPIEERKSARKASQGKKTFGEVADALIEARAAAWRNPKHKAQWKMTLTIHAAPLRSLAVDEIDTEAVLSVLQPLWPSKPETASRLRGRIEAVLDAARARGYTPPHQANPARWRGHLDALLPKRHKLTRGHYAAMDYTSVPGLIARLHERGSMAALALGFTILTAARSGEVRGARWSEIDLIGKVWTIPADRTKSARPHRVPLSAAALTILAKLDEAKTGDYIFTGVQSGRSLSANAMAMVLRRMKIEGATPHGFRSAFRDWAGNETRFPRELAEAALAHTIGDKAEQAYRRGDALEKRRSLMEAWGGFCASTQSTNIVPLKRA